MNYTLTGEMSIQFNTQVHGEDKVNKIMEKFNELTLLLNDFTLETEKEELHTNVLDFGLRWVNVEDEDGEIFNVEYF